MSLVEVKENGFKMKVKLFLPPCQLKKGEEPIWIGAVNDTGTKIALHCASDFKVYYKLATIEK